MELHSGGSEPCEGFRSGRAPRRPPWRVASSGAALAAQNRYTLKVPDGLAFAEFRGYDTWETVAVSQTKGAVKVISGKPR